MNREGSSRHVANRTEAPRMKRGSIVLRTNTVKARDITQLVQGLLSMHKALGWIPNNT